MTSPAAPREFIDASCPEYKPLNQWCASCLRAELARVQGELEIVCSELEIVCIDRDEVVLESAAQIERLTQELELLRIRQHRMDIQELRVLIDGYQGTCFPLNRTSLHGLFDEIERQAQEIAALREELARWKPKHCGQIYPVPVPGEVVKWCDRLPDHEGAHQTEDGFVWAARLDAASAEAQG